MQTPKLILTDLDGTLLRDDKRLSPANRTALERAAARGCQVVLATGRSYASLPGELRAVCDPGKMARVFDNLLNNACHYAYSDSVLRVAARTEEAQIVITFRNAGPTIPAEKLSRMFEQFFRLDASRGTHTGNAGLGLAIAKEIVEAHGGTITARSKEEEVLFTVTLPR